MSNSIERFSDYVIICVISYFDGIGRFTKQSVQFSVNMYKIQSWLQIFGGGAENISRVPLYELSIICTLYTNCIGQRFDEYVARYYEDTLTFTIRAMDKKMSQTHKILSRNILENIIRFMYESVFVLNETVISMTDPLALRIPECIQCMDIIVGCSDPRTSFLNGSKI